MLFPTTWVDKTVVLISGCWNVGTMSKGAKKGMLPLLSRGFSALYCVSDKTWRFSWRPIALPSALHSEVSSSLSADWCAVSNLNNFLLTSGCWNVGNRMKVAEKGMKSLLLEARTRRQEMAHFKSNFDTAQDQVFSTQKLDLCEKK